jgi:hypothetical protein
MQCQQTEPRLQELLDSRCEIDSDPALAAHCEVCPDCAALAAAYDVLGRESVSSPSNLPLDGLADRVVADVVMNERAKPQAAKWPTWATWAVAASLLVAAGLAIRNAGLPNGDEIAPVIANDDEDAADSPMVHNVPGQEMWYRTGQGLASISLTSLRTRDVSAIDAESASDGQLFQRAYDAVRQMWPPQGENPAPNGETGWFYPASPLVRV